MSKSADNTVTMLNGNAALLPFCNETSCIARIYTKAVRIVVEPEGVLPYKNDGRAGWEHFENIPKRYQSFILWAHPKYIFTPNRY